MVSEKYQIGKFADGAILFRVLRTDGSRCSVIENYVIEDHDGKEKCRTDTGAALAAMIGYYCSKSKTSFQTELGEHAV